MMDELDRKERQAASEKSEEEQARARLKVGAASAQPLPVRLISCMPSTTVYMFDCVPLQSTGVHRCTIADDVPAHATG